MKEMDKGWKTSPKLQAAVACFIGTTAIYLDNRHNTTIADHCLSIFELAGVFAFGGRIAMGVTESIMGQVSSEVGKFTYTPDPKDVDDGTVS